MTSDLPGALTLPPRSAPELSPAKAVRWPVDVLARVDAVAARTGLDRSAVLRLAVVEGLPAVERLGQ